jgi:hypothetical protein
MAVWARSERTFAIDAGRWGGLLKRPSFFGCGHRLALAFCVLGTPTVRNSR